MRINRFFTDLGICSRRKADAWIEAGRVTINGKPAVLGAQVDPNVDQVALDGKLIKPRSNEDRVYLVLHKPKGITCTTDLRDPTNIISFLSYPERIFPIGRLDKDSEGLILLTNDGDIVNKVLRARYGHEKEYVVELDHEITPDYLEGMRQGVYMFGHRARCKRIRQIGPRKVIIVLTQGLNRQIRRMSEHFGYEVVRLQRIRFMNIRLGRLPVGSYRKLTDRELTKLKTLAESRVATVDGPTDSTPSNDP